MDTRPLVFFAVALLLFVVGEQTGYPLSFGSGCVAGAGLFIWLRPWAREAGAVRRERRIAKRRAALGDYDLTVLSAILDAVASSRGILESELTAKLGIDAAQLREVAARLRAADLVGSVETTRFQRTDEGILYLSRPGAAEWFAVERERRDQLLEASGQGPGPRQRISQLAK